MNAMLKINRVIGDPETDFQVNVTVPGKSWARSFTRASLEEFLLNSVVADEAGLDTLFEDLHAHGNTLIEEIRFSENDLRALGFEPVPTDF